ncbi:HAD family hydrolase [Erysipelotrichaceae bacterium HCN-30851]
MNKIRTNIKAFFFDIDGTFYDHKQNKVLPSSIEAVKKLKQAGYKVALCSGRPLEMAKQLPVFEGIQWDGFIGSAGSTVYDEHLNLIKHDSFSSEELKEIFEISKEHDICLYVNGNTSYLTQNDDETINILRKFHVEIPKEIRSFKETDRVEIISMFKGYDYDYSFYMHIPSLRLQKSSGSIVDIVKDGVCKYSGIQELLRYWNLQDAEYAAFGDSMNDQDMLEHAKLGIVMQNGDHGLHSFADYICGPSYEDSIYDTLQSFQFID